MNSTNINNSIVYLPKHEIDNETFNLIDKMTLSPALNNIRIMPDCHSSSYCCIGMTSKIEDKVIPQIVGGDIGCGILVYNLKKVIKEKHYKKIDDFIKNNIPMGENSHKVPVIEKSYLSHIFDNCNIKLEHLLHLLSKIFQHLGHLLPLALFTSIFVLSSISET